MTKFNVGLASNGKMTVMNFTIFDGIAQTLKDDTHTQNMVIS
jgi:hypothetical protein